MEYAHKPHIVSNSKRYTVIGVVIGMLSNKPVQHLERNAVNLDEEITLQKYVARRQLNHCTTTVSKKKHLMMISLSEHLDVPMK